MKAFYLIIILASVLVSCDDIFPKDENETSTEKSKKKNKIYNGIRKNFYQGNLASEVTYKDSLKNGPAINYYPDGKVNMEFEYVNNLKHGPFKWYFESGKIYMEGAYHEGEKDGVFKIYRETGELKSEMPWHKGNPCVGLVEYFESGKKKPSPKLKIKHKNTIKLDGQYTLEIWLSEKTRYAKFYKGYLEENQSLPGYFVDLEKQDDKAIYSFYIAPGQLIMQTHSFVAKLKAADDNYYIIAKDVNVSAENRRSVAY